MKKLLFLGIILQVGLVYTQFESRIFEVMYKGPGGIEQVNNRILFSEAKNLAYDLNLSEISSRFGCKTMIGKEFLVRYLEKIVSPKDQNSTIKNRQNMIQLLIDHPELQQKFEELMGEAIKHEAVVMKFMQKRFDPNFNDGNSLVDSIAFVQHALARNTLWQTAKLWWDAVGISQGAVGGFKYGWNSATSAYQNYVDTKNSFSSFLNDKNASLTDGVGSLLQRGSLGASDAIKDMALITIGLKGPSDHVISKTYSLMMFVFAAKSMYDNYTAAYAIRDSLYSLNRLIDIAQQIEGVCRQHNVEHQFKISSIKSEAGLKLLEDLQHDRYQNKDDYFILTPAVHTFLYDVYEHDSYLAPMYASIAEMDAYLAIAKKMIKLQSSDHKLCFVQFLDSEKPTVHAKDFWNMLVGKDNVVINDIFEDRNIILTGSNEGGKTTSIRAILQNIVLAQTFGIAAASEFKLTQFDVLHSYLNVSDDILTGKSRFASELKQAQDILNRIKALNSNEKFFFAFDELFTGTNGEDGAECAYRFIDNIASYKGIQFIYATHFNKLKMIGAANPACVNYKIEPPLRDSDGQFIRDDKGQLMYPYKLSLGANDVNVAMHRAKDAGIFA